MHDSDLINAGSELQEIKVTNNPLYMLIAIMLRISADAPYYGNYIF